MTVLVTGAAGFIGFHLCQRLLREQTQVVGVDNLTSYYDVQLKRDRLELLRQFGDFSFWEKDVAHSEEMMRLFDAHKPSVVIHLAAQAGVRYSLTNPHSYIQSNIAGFLNVLEGCRHHEIGHLIYASSSSVYGANTKMPFSTRDPVNHPLSLYAATKKSNELMAHSYSSLYQIPVTGLRFFTVYGPWGRPDMALFTFADAIMKGKPVQLFNRGQMKRDFTYIDDIVESIIRLLEQKPTPNREWQSDQPNPSSSYAPYKLYNIGSNNPVDLHTFVSLLEEKLERPAIKEYLPMQPGDVPETYACVEELRQVTGYSPHTTIEEGITRFVQWYKTYYGALYV